MAVVDPNQHDQFVLRQRIRPVINHYEFSLADDEPPFCFVVALFRRLVGLVPFVGDFADWLPIPYHFMLERHGAVIGTHKRRIGKFRDTYDIDVSGDAERSADRRVVLALAVGMDALQAR